MDNLPLEILDKIFENLSIKECRLCWEAHKFSYDDKFKKAYANRKSIDIYLNKYFPNAKELLEYMTAYNVWISGSHALNYFVPGSIDSSSDWDFYMSQSSSRTIYFMEYMKSIGVVWQPTIQYCIEEIESNKEVVRLTYRELQFVFDNLHLIDMPKCNKQELMKMLQEPGFISQRGSQDELYYITRKNQSVRKVILVNDDIYDSLYIVRGKLVYRGRSTNIQLMIVPEGEVLDVIRKFHSSIVQCAITGFMAFHMYSLDAYDRKGSIWDIPLPTESAKIKKDNAIEKYRKRGYILKEHSRHFCSNLISHDTAITRSIGDALSEFIDFDIEDFDETKANCIYQPISLSIKQRRIFEYKWIERYFGLEGHYPSISNKAASIHDIEYYIEMQLSIYDLEDYTNLSHSLLSRFKETLYCHDTYILDNKYIYENIDSDYYKQFEPVVFAV